ncbi:9981_t:CDS:2 [Ambispora leptoticha]|uniref:9981_t:CDS:1 n=1 Tax=Ambispora leptoticha TaxID=144679 RepID=A0A9N8ZJR5_9GLOM|nr:9981_t:CDS:2 [Ambispora leptoticha]
MPPKLDEVPVPQWTRISATWEEEIKGKAYSGSPRKAVRSEKIARVKDLVSSDLHIFIKELANEVGISCERISYILHEELSLHKLCAKWVSHSLSEEYK